MNGEGNLVPEARFQKFIQVILKNNGLGEGGGSGEGTRRSNTLCLNEENIFDEDKSKKRGNGFSFFSYRAWKKPTVQT